MLEFGSFITWAHLVKYMLTVTSLASCACKFSPPKHRSLITIRSKRELLGAKGIAASRRNSTLKAQSPEPREAECSGVQSVNQFLLAESTHAGPPLTFANCNWALAWSVLLTKWL